MTRQIVGVLFTLICISRFLTAVYDERKHLECMTRHPVEHESLTNFLQNHDYRYNDTHLMCLYRCLFFKTGVINGLGELSADRFIDNMLLLPKEIVAEHRKAMVEHIKQCVANDLFQYQEPCDHVFLKMLCFITDADYPNWDTILPVVQHHKDTEDHN